MSKIIFLGSGGSRFVTATQLRGTGGFVLKCGLQVHVDPGPGALVRAKEFGIDIRNTDLILVSHHHLDHADDVNAVIDAVNSKNNSYDGSKVEIKYPVLIGTETVVNGSSEDSAYVSDYHKKLLEEIYITKDSKKFSIKNLDVECIGLKHNTPDCFGFKIFTEKSVVGYISDTNYFAGLVKSFSDCDVLIINVELPFGKKWKGYLSSDDVVKILNKVKPKLCVITHFSHLMLDAKPLYEARKIQKETGIQVIPAEDGLVLDLDDYSAGRRNKSLKSF